MPRKRQLAIALFLLIQFAAAFALDSPTMEEFATSIKARVTYDPLSRSGYFEQEGSFVSFALDQPIIALDWKKVRKVPAPYLGGDAILIPAGFAREVESFFSEKNQSKKEKYRVAAILIDPGHGGKDTGAISEVAGEKLLEKDLTLEVSRRVVDLLASRFPGRDVLITRKGDSYPTLDERVSMANSVALKNDEAVIYVSIHANASFNKNARGFEVWYLNPEYRRTVVDADTLKEKGTEIAPILNAMLEEEFTTESIILARKVYDRMGVAIGKQIPGRGIRAEEWFVVRNAKMPSILIEMGFITHPEEGALLAGSNYLRKIGDAIYNGIVDFIEHFER